MRSPRARKGRKLAPREAFQNFLKDVEQNYEPVLGLKQTIRDLDGRKRSVEKELEKWEATKAELDGYCRAKQKQIDAYERLSGKGIDDRTLLLWDGALSRSGLDKATVAAELEQYGTLEQRRQGLLEEIAGEEARGKGLASEVQTLESSKASVGL